MKLRLRDDCPDCGGRIGSASSPNDGFHLTRYLFCRSCKKRHGIEQVRIDAKGRVVNTGVKSEPSPLSIVCDNFHELKTLQSLLRGLKKMQATLVWKQAIAKFREQGMTQAEAILAVDRRDPTLRQRMLTEAALHRETNKAAWQR